MARRSKLTPEVQQRICDAIVIGATYEHAAAYGGISYDTFNEWNKTKPQFSEEVKAAEARAVVGWLAKIEKAASEGTWQAAAWKLERRYPDLYGRTVQQVEAKVSTTLDATVVHLEAVRAHVQEADVERLTRALLGTDEVVHDHDR